MRKTGDEPIKFRGKDTGLRLRDFWSWGFSDLLDNTLRGSYAEFIVAAALGIDLSEARELGAVGLNARRHPRRGQELFLPASVGAEAPVSNPVQHPSSDPVVGNSRLGR